MKDIIYNICTSNLEIDEETNQSKDFNQILGSLSQFNNCVFLGGIDNNLISIEDDELNIITLHITLLSTTNKKHNVSFKKCPFHVHNNTHLHKLAVDIIIRDNAH